MSRDIRVTDAARQNSTASVQLTPETGCVPLAVATTAAVSLGFGAQASAGGEPIEPIIPDFELPELPDTPITLPDDFVPIPPGEDPEITTPDDFVPLPELPDPTIPDDFVPLPELPDPTVPDDLAPTPPDDDSDPHPTDPVDPVDPGQPQDPTPGTPSGSLPETGASTMVVAGLALAATTAGAFLCLAAGRRSRTANA
jgi:hypothetical protein